MISTAELVVAIANTYKGAKRYGTAEQQALFKDIISTFNTVKPNGEVAHMSDWWCAESVTSWEIMAGNTPDEVPMSYNCDKIISIAKSRGIWEEDESKKPNVGDYVLYNWSDGNDFKTTDLKKAPNHIGIAVKVSAKTITVLEGNMGKNSVCGIREVDINGQFLRGFVQPRYSPLTASAYKPKTPYGGQLPTTTIHYGSSGTQAKKLQQFLNWILGTNLAVDGQFGRKSTEALLVYQKTYNLVTDGSFGTVSKKTAERLIKASHEAVEPPKTYDGTYPALVRKVTDRQKLLADKANELAYTTNTKEANYPEGHPKDAYKKALAKLPMSGHSWSKAAKKGASCDVFVWTCIRSSGIDTPKRAGLWYLTNYLKDSDKVKMVKASEAQPGDIGMYRKKKSGLHGHIFMLYATFKDLKANEKGKVKEASAGHYYGKTTNSLRDRLNTKNKRYVYVFRYKRVVTERALKKGDKGENAENLQKYLNWYFRPKYGKDVLVVDGDFGTITEKYLELFQTEQKITVDGKCGSQTIKAMKGVAI